MQKHLIPFDNVERELNGYEYPAGYNATNAKQAAMIEFEKNGWFMDCTEESRAKCILDMFVQGLNPLKGQCYFIPQKNKDKLELQLRRHYSGSIMVAKQVDPSIYAIRSKIVREGDDFKFEIRNGLYVITRHEPTIRSLNGQPIAAYALAVDQSERVIDLEIMNYDQYISHVKQHSYPIKGEPIVRENGTFHPWSNHAKYPEQMYKKTLIHKLCRSIIRSSPNEKIITADERSKDDDYVSDDIVVSEPEIKTLDFAPRQESRPESQQEMATKDQAEKILEIAKQIGELDYMVTDVSSFVQRDIKKLRELSKAEADRYIEMKLKSIASEPLPDEQTTPDDPPPWKK